METERKRAFLINILYALVVAAIFVFVFSFGLSMLAPFVAAFLVAYLLHGPTRWISKKLRLPQKPVALLLVLLFYCTVGLLLVFLGIKAVAGVRILFNLLPHLYVTRVEPVITDCFNWLEELVLKTDVSLISLIQTFNDQVMDWMGSAITRLSAWAVTAVSNMAMGIPGLFLKIVLMIISSFFMAADYDRLVGFCLRQMNEKTKELFWQVKHYLVGTLFVCIASYALIIFITFLELSIGLTIIGIEQAVIIAIAIAIFDILPVLGTGGIMIPWGIINLVRGEFKLGISLLLLYVAITVIRNIIEPKIVGGQLGLHPVVTLSSMFVGVQLFGVVGLFGFPIGLSLLCYLNDQGTVKVFKTKADKAKEAEAAKAAAE